MNPVAATSPVLGRTFLRPLPSPVPSVVEDDGVGVGVVVEVVVGSSLVVVVVVVVSPVVVEVVVSSLVVGS